jgi:hypothetical protein
MPAPVRGQGARAVDCIAALRQVECAQNTTAEGGTMEAGELFDHWLEGAVNRGKQVDAVGVHLTIAEVLTAHGMGRLDFGGSEFQDAGVHALEPLERSPSDRYSWWRLEEGTYGVRFNETLKDGAPVCLLVGSDRLLACGCALAAAVCGPGALYTRLIVPKCGVRIKQNARIALLRPLA